MGLFFFTEFCGKILDISTKVYEKQFPCDTGGVSSHRQVKVFVRSAPRLSEHPLVHGEELIDTIEVHKKKNK